VTTNASHYTSIVNDLKAGGYQSAGSSAAGDDQYSKGDKNVSVSKVVIFDGSAAYNSLFRDGGFDVQKR